MYHEPELRFSVGDAVQSCCKVAVLLLVTIVALPLANAAAQEDPEVATEFVLHAPFPLGSEAFLLMPSKRNFYLLGSIENHDFDGIHVYRLHKQSSVTRDGVRVARYPDEVVFRVTATTITPEGQMDPPSRLDFPQEVSQLLLGLRFQLKVFRGLDADVLEPYDVRMIGIPSDQPADERVYRISFRMHQVPTDARLALEVCTPDGERIARFRIELL